MLEATEPAAAVSINASVEESLKRIEAENPKPKRKRKDVKGFGKPGRPSNADLAARAAEQGAGPINFSGDDILAEPAPAAPQFDYTSDMVMPALEIPGNYMAGKTGFDGFKLLPEQKAALGPLAAVVANKYLPREMGEHGEAWALAFMVSTIAWSQYSAYLAWLEDEKAKRAKSSGDDVQRHG